MGLGNAEVEHLDGAIRSDLDVRRLQVAMDNPGLVGSFERHRDAASNAQRLLGLDGAGGSNVLGEALTFDQLHGDETHPIGLLEAEDRGDVGVVERRQ